MNIAAIGLGVNLSNYPYESVSFTYAVTDGTITNATLGTTFAQMYLSMDTNLDGADVPIGAVLLNDSLVGDLNTGDFHTLTFSGTLPNQDACDYAYVLVKADAPTNVIVEIDETDNVSSTPMTCPPVVTPSPTPTGTPTTPTPTPPPDPNMGRVVAEFNYDHAVVGKNDAADNPLFGRMVLARDSGGSILAIEFTNVAGEVLLDIPILTGTTRLIRLEFPLLSNEAYTLKDAFAEDEDYDVGLDGFTGLFLVTKGGLVTNQDGGIIYTVGPTPTPQVTATPVGTTTPSPTPSASPTPSVTMTASPTPSATASPTPSPSPSVTPTPDPTVCCETVTPTPTPRPTDVPNTGTIEVHVGHDDNNDNTQNPGEKVIWNAHVELYRNNTRIASGLTNILGDIVFVGVPQSTNNLQLRFYKPAAWNFAQKDIGGDDTKDSDADPANGRTSLFSLAIGQTRTDVDCLMRDPSIPIPTATPTPTQTASPTPSASPSPSPSPTPVESVTPTPTSTVGPTITPSPTPTATPIVGKGAIQATQFVDYGWDGQSVGDPGWQSGFVQLYRGGSFVASGFTTPGGVITFVNLDPANNYQLRFFKPSGWVFSPRDIGNNATDSDVDPATGRTSANLVVVADTVTTGIGCGIYDPNAATPTPSPTPSPSPTPAVTPEGPACGRFVSITLPTLEQLQEAMIAAAANNSLTSKSSATTDAETIAKIVQTQEAMAARLGINPGDALPAPPPIGNLSSTVKAELMKMSATKTADTRPRFFMIAGQFLWVGLEMTNPCQEAWSTADFQKRHHAHLHQPYFGFRNVEGGNPSNWPGPEVRGDINVPIRPESIEVPFTNGHTFILGIQAPTSKGVYTMTISMYKDFGGILGPIPFEQEIVVVVDDLINGVEDWETMGAYYSGDLVVE